MPWSFAVTKKLYQWAVKYLGEAKPGQLPAGSPGADCNSDCGGMSPLAPRRKRYKLQSARLVMS